jgi:Mg/Co/Ni transporter MgtE
MTLQLDFFEPNTEEFLLKKEIIEIREQLTKQRKSMFARLGNQEKIIMKQIYYVLIVNMKKKLVMIVKIYILLKIYYAGGVYMDIDRLCNIPLKDVIKPNGE